MAPSSQFEIWSSVWQPYRAGRRRWISAPGTGVLLGPSAAARPRCCAIAGLERQDGGAIDAVGRDSYASLKEYDYGILFQSYALFPNLTVAQNVAYGLSGKRAHQPRRQPRRGNAEPGRPDWGRTNTRADFRPVATACGAGARSAVTPSLLLRMSRCRRWIARASAD